MHKYKFLKAKNLNKSIGQKCHLESEPNGAEVTNRNQEHWLVKSTLLLNRTVHHCEIENIFANVFSLFAFSEIYQEQAQLQ